MPYCTCKVYVNQVRKFVLCLAICWQYFLAGLGTLSQEDEEFGFMLGRFGNLGTNFRTWAQIQALNPNPGPWI